MRNLKRALSLALAAVMVLGMMVVGAGAVSTKDFTDADEIKNTDAVSTMVALGIIKGKEDGSYFDPTGSVTRAEMAKMICVALNGGVDPTLGTKATPSFTDIKGNWAESYIEYCTTMGIIAGRGNGKFDPAGTVTSTEAAKMLLVTLGYDAATTGLTGADWSINTNVAANKAGLYSKLTGLSTTEPMTRDNAAQMIYNALDADMVTLGANGTYDTKQVTTDVVEKIENGSHTVYTVTKGDGTKVTFDDYTAAKDFQTANAGSTMTSEKVADYTYVATTSTTTEDLGRKYLGLYTYSGVVTGVGYVQNKGYTVTLDNALTFTKLTEDAIAHMGEKVKVMYKDADRSNVFGLYTHSDTSITVDGYINDLNGTELGNGDNVLKLDGTAYKSDAADAANIPVVSANGSPVAGAATLSALNASASIAKGSKLTLIDNNGNGKIDVAVVTPVEVYKVNYVSSTDVTLVGVEATKSTINNGAGSYKLEDTVTYDGIVKGDYVAYYDGAACTSDGKDVLAKLEMVSGEITGTRSGEALIDGTWYNTGDTTYSATVGNTVSYVAVGGAIYAAKTTAAYISGQYLVIKGIEKSYNDVNASVLLSDGTSKIVTLEKGSEDGVSYYKAFANSAGTAFAFDKNGNGAYDAPATDIAISNDKLYAYTVNTDGTYRLTEINAATATEDILGVKGQGSAALANKMFGSANISDEAVIFVKDKDGYHIATGKTVKSWGNTVSGVTGTPEYVYIMSNGYRYASAAFISFGSNEAPTASDGAVYGYLVAAPYAAKVDGKSGSMFTIWNGTDDVTLFSSDITGSPAKGDVVKYVVTGESGGNTVGKVQATYGMQTSAVAITAYDESTGKVTFNNMGLNGGDGSPAYEVVSDTKYLYINSADKKGVSGGSISIANKDSAGNLIGDMNAVYVVSTVDSNGNSIKDLALVVVDVANKISGLNVREMNSLAKTGSDMHGLTVSVTPDMAYAAVGQSVTYTVTVSGTSDAGGKNDTVTIALPNLTDADTLADSTPPTANNCSISGMVITVTAASAATSGIFTVSGTVAASDVTPTIAYAEVADS